MAENTADFEFPEPPDPMTEPAFAYFSDAGQLVGFVHFVSALALRADEIARIAAEALRGSGRQEDE